MGCCARSSEYGCLPSKGRGTVENRTKLGKRVARSKFSWATALVGVWMNANVLELFTCNLVWRGLAQKLLVVALWKKKSHWKQDLGAGGRERDLRRKQKQEDPATTPVGREDISPSLEAYTFNQHQICFGKRPTQRKDLTLFFITATSVRRQRLTKDISLTETSPLY